ncbi:uncharacterized protein LOC101161666 isoform X2 [Oryzias latipes]|uniref:uncharacterized protein LOC101161666 isoform X2 n=1 Tax=Oryzias latipes TaxID=8090 RepID=UPI0005CBBCA3|nr:uncharacterized protein LOC101161666 isoform X2 [Oryzias latipes]
MAAHAATVLLLLSPLISPGLSGLSAPSSDAELGRMELRRVRMLAAQPRYGECWARALKELGVRCKDMTSESQRLMALRFTHCHLSSSGRDFPACPEGSDVSRCTGGMDAVAFNTFTEFFTHTNAICHFLQSEAWQNRAEDTMSKLTETSAGVAEELHSTRQMAKDLLEAQSAALQAQEEILSNGEELRGLLRDSTQGLQSVFLDLSRVSKEQQGALSELFHRVSFLQSFLLMEAHSLSSCCYNAAALCTSFLITSTPRSSRARSCCPCTWVCCGGSWWVLGFVFCCWCAYGTGTPCSRACRSCSSSERCTAGCRTRCTAQRGLESWRRGMLDVTRSNQRIEMKRSLERKRRSRAAGLRLKMTLICVCFHLMGGYLIPPPLWSTASWWRTNSLVTA